MRLINTTTYHLTEFFGTHNIPPYAILSHTWGSDEVSFQDFRTLNTASLKAGFAKIQGACAQALEDKLEWCWVDTCCIDKTSSAELSEAINSMFAWYRDAVVCYAYLADVPDTILEAGLNSYESAKKVFCSSKWFTRGWTLQELLAPKEVIFFSAGGKPIGSKTSLHKVITEATGIQSQYLGDVSQISQASIARKMSWASKRLTTRIEDLAYCLFGIFELNMALVYGEGPRSFIRLQEEILKQSDDQSIFCWVWDDAIVPDQWPSILAPCPAVFANSGAFMRLSLAQDDSPVRSYNITNAGLSITLPLLPTPNPRVFCALLQVMKPSDNGYSPVLYRASIILEKGRIFHRCSVPAAPFEIDRTMEGFFENIYIQCKSTSSNNRSAKVPETLDLNIYDVGFMLTLGKPKPGDFSNAFSIEFFYATPNVVYKNNRNLLLFSFSGVNASETFGAAIFKINSYYSANREIVALAVRSGSRAADDDALAFSFHCAISPWEGDWHSTPAKIIREIDEKLTMKEYAEFADNGMTTVALGGKINFSDSGSDWKRNTRIVYIVHLDEDKEDRSEKVSN